MGRKGQHHTLRIPNVSILERRKESNEVKKDKSPGVIAICPYDSDSVRYTKLADTRNAAWRI